MSIYSSWATLTSCRRFSGDESFSADPSQALALALDAGTGLGVIIEAKKKGDLNSSRL